MPVHPQVSILIPAYNSARYIAETLQSAQAQTVTEIEILVIDDGSQDDTQAVVHAFSEKDGRIRLIQQMHEGTSAARNRGLTEAKGRFIAFLDSDDLWAPDKLEAQLAVFARTNAGLVHTGVADMDAEGNPCPPVEPWGRSEGRVFDTLLRSNFICCSSVMVTAELLQPPHPRFLVGRLCEDWLLWTELSTQCSFAYVDRPLVHYRIHAGGASRNHEAFRDAELLCRLDFLELAKRVGSPSEIKIARKALFHTYCSASKRALRRDQRPEAWSHWKRARALMPPTPESLVRLVSVLLKYGFDRRQPGGRRTG